ncbi:MAG: hypothetical protein LH645_11825 [Actinomycetia bacterium]|nr:hypothetical protein [Actinomycetes bacterium]
MSSINGLALSLIDDAAVFPPGNASLDDAITGYYNRFETNQQEIVGPLLIPASAVDSLRTHADPLRMLDVAIVGDTGFDGLVAARDSLENDTWIAVQHVELRAPSDGAIGESVGTLLGALAFTVPTYVELPVTEAPAGLNVLAADGAERAKFRTGPYEVPSPDQLAAAIGAAVRLRVPFKLTGGLHHALPTHDEASNRQHHGLLNVLAATAAATEEGDDLELARLLASADPDQLLAQLGTVDAGVIRRHFKSVGSCSIDEPYQELVRYGVVEES